MDITIMSESEANRALHVPLSPFGASCVISRASPSIFEFPPYGPSYMVDV